MGTRMGAGLGGLVLREQHCNAAGVEVCRSTWWSQWVVLWDHPFISVILDGTALRSKPSAASG